MDRDVLVFFNNVTISGNEKGAAVRQSCPYNGPLTDIELQAVVENAREAFRVGKIHRADYAILLVLVVTGCRPGQVSMLVCRDLMRPTVGQSAWQLHVPSLKKRTEERLTRIRPIPHELARLLDEQTQMAARDKCMADIAPNIRPIFYNREMGRHSDVRYAHIGRDGVLQALQRIGLAITVRSERTGEPIVLKPGRFRRTFGTRAVEEGYALTVVAEMLDHSDLQNVSVYVENRSSIVDRIDAVLAAKLGPIARLFLGRIIDDESQAGVEDPVSRRVGTGRSRPVGTCGGPSACARHAPIACYTCVEFMPWLDAPHERLLHELIEDRDRLLASGLDPRIAAVNDSSILAIADVIERCRLSKGAAALA